jgi:hypothetical protein
MAEGKDEGKTQSESVPAGEVGHCVLPPVEPRQFGPGFDPGRMEAILVSEDKWVNGTELRYHFIERPPDTEDLDVVRAAFKEWQDLPIGVRFREVGDRNESEVRIGFDHGDGSWSYLGRQVLDRPSNERTMNFGWKLSDSGYGYDTALHEIGHTLGLPHEHQNPHAGIVWDEQAVLQYFGGPPNSWTPDKTRWNILRKIDPDTVQGSSWDRDSVMHYQFRAGLILLPEDYRTRPLIPAGGLSQRDGEWVRNFYPPEDQEPPELQPFRSERFTIRPGEQVGFSVRPPATRNYTLQTFGSIDTVMVLFEDVDTGPEEGQGLRFQAGDDDSGTDLNARFTVKLFKGRSYVLRIRLYWAWATGEAGVMMW